MIVTFTHDVSELNGVDSVSIRGWERTFAFWCCRKLGGVEVHYPGDTGVPGTDRGGIFAEPRCVVGCYAPRTDPFGNRAGNCHPVKGEVNGGGGIGVREASVGADLETDGTGNVGAVGDLCGTVVEGTGDFLRAEGTAADCFAVEDQRLGALGIPNNG